MADTMEIWAVLELMGHVKLAGKVTEEERFGSKMGRIDIPGPVRCACDGTGGMNDIRNCPECSGSGQVTGFTTQYFGGSSIYRMTPVSEEVARAVAANDKPAPISPWELPRNLLPAPASTPLYDDEPDEDDDE